MIHIQPSLTKRAWPELTKASTGSVCIELHTSASRTRSWHGYISTSTVVGQTQRFTTVLWPEMNKASCPSTSYKRRETTLRLLIVPSWETGWLGLRLVNSYYLWYSLIERHVFLPHSFTSSESCVLLSQTIITSHTWQTGHLLPVGQQNINPSWMTRLTLAWHQVQI